MLGALMMFGLRPGPLLIQEHPNLFWGLIASMYLGNTMLVILNLPLVGLFARMLDVPRDVLLPMVLAFSFLGVWAEGTSTFDVVLLTLFGILGYCMRRLGFPAAPMLLGLILGQLLEQAQRQALSLSGGNPAIFVARPPGEYGGGEMEPYVAADPAGGAGSGGSGGCRRTCGPPVRSKG